MAESNINGLRKTLFESGKRAVGAAGDKLQERLKKLEGGENMSTAESLALQFEIGEYSNLVQTVTNIEKMMRDAINATARNTG